MILQSKFKVDRFQLKHTSDPVGLLKATKDFNAAALGLELVKNFPFIKNEAESFQGELPEMSLNRDHPFFDLYECRVVVISEGEWELLCSLITQRQ